MSKVKILLVLAICLAVVMVVIGVAACGSSSDDNSTPAASSSGGSLSGSAADRAKTILGHDPTGLAKEIVDKGVVIVANDANYPPQSSVDKATGELVGFDVDVAKAMAEILGLQVKFENPAWATIPAGLNQGKYDVSIGSMTITPARQKNLDFTDPYYYTSGQIFVKQGGTQITGPSDLNGKKVGVGAATTYEQWLKDNTTADVSTYTTDADAFPDLRNGNIDFVMTAGPTGQQAIQEGQPFEFSGEPLYYEDLAFAIKKGEADWLALLNYTVQTMHKDGSLKAMSEKWYNGLDLTTK
jgi:polar amino acid transport system substrate-binding protein